MAIRDKRLTSELDTDARASRKSYLGQKGELCMLENRLKIKNKTGMGSVREKISCALFLLSSRGQVQTFDCSMSHLQTSKR